MLSIELASLLRSGLLCGWHHFDKIKRGGLWVESGEKVKAEEATCVRLSYANVDDKRRIVG